MPRLASHWLGIGRGLDVSPDGKVVVAAAHEFVIAHSTATGEVIWREEMSGEVWSLRIHGGVVVVPVDDSCTVVLDVTTGHLISSLPSAGTHVIGTCVFDGLTRHMICLSIFFTPCYYLSAAYKSRIEGE